MELRHLRYFVAVAEELHFGRAAERLHIAQPPLSQQIQQLEREMGVLLFRRANRRVTLTVAGHVFLEEIRRSLASIEQAVQKARRADKGEVGTLSVGFVASATYEILPALLPIFREHFPDVELLLYELTAAEQASALHEKQIDVGFARPFIEDPDLVLETVAQEPFLVALPQAHPLALQKTIPLASLAREPFILFPDQPKPAYADAVKAVCALAGFTPTVVQEAREMQTAISLIAAGIGITLVPASVQNLQRKGVIYRPLQEKEPKTELTVAYRRDDVSPVLQQFLASVRALESE